jgi:hypothetical protein
MRQRVRQAVPAEVKSEKDAIMKIGLSYLEDTTCSISRRIHNFRVFLRKQRIEKEKNAMIKFKAENGFEATDDVAKRKVVDSLFYSVYQRYPVDDTERNEYTYTGTSLNIMKIGWRPDVYRPM